jgi:hypothetical protein
MKVLQILVLIFGFAIFADAQNAVLSGSVYDPNGALIINANVTAINEKGEKFETITNNEGVYILNLPFNIYDTTKSVIGFKVAKYEIIIESVYFEKLILKDFKFVSSTEGKMTLDFALDVVKFINYGPGGCCFSDLEIIDEPKLKVSDNISLIPLEELSKENKSIEVNFSTTPKKTDTLFILSGKVKFKEKLVSDAYVQLRDEKGIVYSTKSDETGKYKLELPTGNYYVFANGGPKSCNFVGCTPEFYKKDFLINKKRKVNLNIILDYVGEG